jgi:hypothetical protein
MTRTAPLWLVTLAACTTPWGLGGNDIDDNPDDVGLMADDTQAGDSPEAPAGVATVPLTVAVGGVSCDPGAAVPSLDVAAGVGGALAVTQTGIAGSCCSEWRFDALATGDTVIVAYTDANAGNHCDCSCSWTFDLAIGDVPPGTWAVVATPTSAASASVE